MADTATTPTAKVTVLNPPALPFSPIAVHIPTKLRATALKLVAELKPEGNPNPDLLAIAKQTATALINSFDESATGIEIKIETNSGSAKQVHVIVIPHNL